MTPCEKLGYKVGDRFEVIAQNGSDAQVGWVVVLYEDDGSNFPFFYKVGEEFERTYCPKLTEIRPLKTEAEKRGAKFGTMGVIKPTGEKCIFIKENGYMWRVCAENGDACNYVPKNIRLDHEPEYKEIPFSEATHEQRMDHKNVLWDGHAGAFSEVLFTHSNTYILTVRSKVLPLIYTTHRTEGHTNPTGITVRIPT